MTFDRFDVALTWFPFTGRRDRKVRPVVVLTSDDFHRSHDHLIAGMVTTAARTQWRSDIDIGDYRHAGLKTPCVIRMKLFTLQLNLIFGRIGTLARQDRKALEAALEQAFTAP